jgi:hypothetical protein
LQQTTAQATRTNANHRPESRSQRSCSRLARTLHSTNTIESMIAICRDHAANVKRWQDGTMAPR